jgi:adenosylmethionine-8-amino-7-oxononanoate aminotransferase
VLLGSFLSERLPAGVRSGIRSGTGLGAWLAAAIRERGVITRLLCGDALQVSPPLVVTEAELGQIASVFAAALDAELP